MNDEPTLPPPPILPIPAHILIADTPLARTDPRVERLQLLENWVRVYRHYAQELLEEIWSDPRQADQSTLGKVTGLSRMGLRKRAQPDYAAEINRKRRQRQNTDKETPS